jgi:hypothetical protein
MAKSLACPDPSRPTIASCVSDAFAGPAWGHINMKPGTLTWFLRWGLGVGVVGDGGGGT